MLCYIMLCHVTSCHVTSCDVMSYLENEVDECLIEIDTACVPRIPCKKHSRRIN